MGTSSRRSAGWRRLRGALLVAAIVIVALLSVVLGAITWLIVRHQSGWNTADKIGAITIAVTIGAGIGAVFGPSLVDRTLNRPQPPDPIQQGREQGKFDRSRYP